MFACGARDIPALRKPGILIEVSDRLKGQTSNPPRGDSPQRPDVSPNIAQAVDFAQSPRAGREELAEFASRWLPRVEEEMREILAAPHAAHAAHYAMMHYHLGWADEALQPLAVSSGKRIRPLLCLMACEAVGGNPADAIPAAAAVEILHNFSLVHDDIEDGDETRRHRPTLWALWGVPQAINVGDGMFALAYKALLRMGRRADGTESFPAAHGALEAADLFSEACIRLTEGQHLDLSFEERVDVSSSEYLQMIEGKTAALIAGSTALGALFGGAERRQEQLLGSFGRNLGLAFQIQDDILGIWGDPAVTGKAVGNDILRRKKSLPLLYASEHPAAASRMVELWRGGIEAESLPEVLNLLEEAGSRRRAEDSLSHFHYEGLKALSAALGDGAQDSLLLALAGELFHRQF